MFFPWGSRALKALAIIALAGCFFQLSSAAKVRAGHVTRSIQMSNGGPDGTWGAWKIW
jgi:hypothetical protein